MFNETFTIDDVEYTSSISSFTLRPDTKLLHVSIDTSYNNSENELVERSNSFKISGSGYDLFFKPSAITDNIEDQLHSLLWKCVTFDVDNIALITLGRPLRWDEITPDVFDGLQ